MPTSATGSKPEQGFTPLWRSAENGFTALSRSAENGFTLIELMVVVAIIGLASAAVVVALPDPRGRVVDEAERFAAHALAVRDDAIVEGRAMSLLVDAHGYRVERRSHGRWETARDPAFAPVDWKPGTLAQVGGEPSARATFDPVGSAEPQLELALSRDQASVKVHIDAVGRIRVGN